MKQVIVITGASSGFGRLTANAPITMRVAKESIRRLAEALPEGDDLVRAAYSSDDFKAGVRAFLAKEQPKWTGR